MPKTRGYVVTNTAGQWLAYNSQNTSRELYIWESHISHAHVFESSLAARIAAFHHGGYVIELSSTE